MFGGRGLPGIKSTPVGPARSIFLLFAILAKITFSLAKAGGNVYNESAAAMLKHPAAWPKPSYKGSDVKTVPSSRVPIYDPSLKCFRCPLICGTEMLMDDDDLWFVPLASWKSYGRGRHPAATISLHRLVMRAERGQQVDHVHGDKMDARKAELRFCTGSQNCMGRGKNRKSGDGECSSRFKGVCFDSVGGRDGGKWLCQIRVDGILKRIGRFHSEVDAAKAYDAAAFRQFGRFANLNFSEVIPLTPISDNERYPLSASSSLIQTTAGWPMPQRGRLIIRRNIFNLASCFIASSCEPSPTR